MTERTERAPPTPEKPDHLKTAVALLGDPDRRPPPAPHRKTPSEQGGCP